MLIPFDRFKAFLPRLGTTPDDEGGITHSHVVIINSESRYYIRLDDEHVDVSQFVF